MTPSEHKDLFLPPVSEPSARAFVLALGAHLLLLVALTWGISWHQQAELESSTAELWSSIPNLTLQAPPPVVVTPEPEPTPVTKPEPPPKPTPLVKPPAPALAQAELGIEKLKKDKILQEEKKAAEKKALKEKLDKEKLEKEKIEKAKAKAKEK